MDVCVCMCDEDGENGHQNVNGGCLKVVGLQVTFTLFHLHLIIV